MLRTSPGNWTTLAVINRPQARRQELPGKLVCCWVRTRRHFRSLQFHSIADKSNAGEKPACLAPAVIEGSQQEPWRNAASQPILWLLWHIQPRNPTYSGLGLPTSTETVLHKYVTLVSLVPPGGQRRCWVPWDWSHRWFWGPMEMLGELNLALPEKQPVLLASEPFLQP